MDLKKKSSINTAEDIERPIWASVLTFLPNLSDTDLAAYSGVLRVHAPGHCAFNFADATRTFIKHE